MSYDNEAKMAVAAINVPTRPTLRRTLEERKKGAEEHLANLNQALKFLDANPNFEEFHNLIGKTGF